MYDNTLTIEDQKVFDEYKNSLISNADLSSIKSNLWIILETLKDNVSFYWCDYSDSTYCPFCDEEDDKHSEDCFYSYLEKALKNKKTFPNNKFNHLCFLITDGHFYHTCCNDMHIDCCSFCGQYNGHEDNCAQQEMIKVLGDIYLNISNLLSLKYQQLIEKNKQRERDLLNRRQQAINKNTIKQLNANKLRWKKIAKEQNKTICPYCFKPFSNLDLHLEKSTKCNI